MSAKSDSKSEPRFYPLPLPMPGPGTAHSYEASWKSYFATLPSNLCQGNRAQMQYPRIFLSETLTFEGLELNHWNCADTDHIFKAKWSSSVEPEGFLSGHMYFRSTFGQFVRFCVARGESDIMRFLSLEISKIILLVIEICLCRKLIYITSIVLYRVYPSTSRINHVLEYISLQHSGAS